MAQMQDRQPSDREPPSVHDGTRVPVEAIAGEFGIFLLGSVEHDATVPKEDAVSLRPGNAAVPEDASVVLVSALSQASDSDSKAAALSALAKVDPALALPFAEEAAESNDPIVALHVAELLPDLGYRGLLLAQRLLTTNSIRYPIEISVRVRDSLSGTPLLTELVPHIIDVIEKSNAERGVFGWIGFVAREAVNFVTEPLLRAGLVEAGKFSGKLIGVIPYQGRRSAAVTVLELCKSDLGPHVDRAVAVLRAVADDPQNIYPLRERAEGAYRHIMRDCKGADFF